MQLRRRHDDPRWLGKVGLLGGLATGAVVMLLLLPAIPQDPSYHRFADARALLGIPNFWNVASNLPLLLVGVAGLLAFARGTPAGSIPALHVAYRVFFAGIALIAAGSAWYHLAPSNTSLVWDRLPMSVTFMAFLAVIIGENVSVAGGIRLLWPLATLGLLAVLYWYTSELGGAGDLRPYVLVQFLPLLLIPVILLLFRAAFSSNAWIWLALCVYGLAKVVEHADHAIFGFVGIGGHTLKHLLSALGALCFLVGLLRRRGTGALKT